MKRFFSIAAFICSVGVSAYSQSSTTTICADETRTFTTADSVKVKATLTAGDLFYKITWSQVAGPTITVPAASQINVTSSIGVSMMTLPKLAVGRYVFSALGQGIGGSSISIKDTVNIVAAPLPPAPRAVISNQVLLFGTWFTVPAGSYKLGYDDGSKQ